MSRTLKEQLAKRPVDEARVANLEKQLRQEVRAAKLRELRQELQITQVELAKQLDITQNRVSQIETGELARTRVDTLKRYVEALGGTLTIQASFGDSKINID